MASYVVDVMSHVPMKVFSQCAGAGIDLYTNWVIMVVSRKFKLSVQGQRNINNALNNLPVYSTPEEKLTFGWTLDHALRNRGVHEGGYEHLASEVALSEVFPEHYAAHVLRNMAITYAGDSDILPHFRQLRGLVRSSNGIFASSDVGLLVEEYVRLNPSSNFALQATSEDSRRVPSPKALSLALTTLAQVTNGTKQQMTVVGGPVLGWLAAISEWLFDLRIAIYSSGGEKLHVSRENQPTQVLLVYDDKAGIHVQIESWTEDSVQAKEAAARPHADTDADEVGPIQFGGRVAWNSLLLRVFGDSFHRLNHEQARILGVAIGAAARTLEGLAEDKDFGDHSSLPRNANSPSLGAGLIQTLIDWLPELRHLQSRMERQLRLSAADAREAYVEQIHKLQSMCACSICTPTEPATSTPHTQHPPQGYCLTTLVETIISLGLTLSRITVAVLIYPTRCGIQSVYAHQVAKRVEARTLDVGSSEYFKLVYWDEWSATDVARLQRCAEIFSGSRPTSDMPANLVALAHEGICAYLVQLAPSAGPEAGDGLIRVVSGAICVRQKIFRRACLGPVADVHQLDTFWEEVPCAHLSHSLYCT